VSDITRDRIERLMKRCQIGVGGRHALDDAHDIMAECYGSLGAMMIEIERLRLQVEHMRETASRSVSRELYEAHLAELRGKWATAAADLLNAVDEEYPWRSWPHGKLVAWEALRALVYADADATSLDIA